jgi:hypothetical protein
MRHVHGHHSKVGNKRLLDDTVESVLVTAGKGLAALVRADSRRGTGGRAVRIPLDRRAAGPAPLHEVWPRPPRLSQKGFRFSPNDRSTLASAATLEQEDGSAPAPKYAGQQDFVCSAVMNFLGMVLCHVTQQSASAT